MQKSIGVEPGHAKSQRHHGNLTRNERPFSAPDKSN